ncbi:hypothetical protein [uncultured Muribaculum sp.]|nr:hypothetical protein [uncultured Muribaculum sp.]
MNSSSATLASRSVDSSCQCQSLKSPAWYMVVPSAVVTRKLTPSSVDL